MQKKVPCVSKIQLHGVRITHRLRHLGQLSNLFGSSFHDNHELFEAATDGWDGGYKKDMRAIQSSMLAAIEGAGVMRSTTRDALDIAVSVRVCSCHHFVDHVVVKLSKQLFDGAANRRKPWEEVHRALMQMVWLVWVVQTGEGDRHQLTLPSRRGKYYRLGYRQSRERVPQAVHRWHLTWQRAQK